mmetsp:Transcript_24814/g.49631  ORF Transcript_24814/g.49631 Transcript_24814/m.49631 type:complete len:90 (+) Transcript_24814:261-530(+)
MVVFQLLSFRHSIFILLHCSFSEGWRSGKAKAVASGIVRLKVYTQAQVYIHKFSSSIAFHVHLPSEAPRIHEILPSPVKRHHFSILHST